MTLSLPNSILLPTASVNNTVGRMRLSTRGRYGTRLVLDLALHWGEGPVLLKDIAQRQEISLPYLEHLITPLVAGRIVKSTRGPRGGVCLVRRPEEIRLSEVIRLLEGSVAPVECVNNPEAYPRSHVCVTHDIWDELTKAIDQVLESTSLQDLVERQRQKWNLKKLQHCEEQRSNGSDADFTEQMRNESAVIPQTPRNGQEVQNAR